MADDTVRRCRPQRLGPRQRDVGRLGARAHHHRGHRSAGVPRRIKGRSHGEHGRTRPTARGTRWRMASRWIQQSAPRAAGEVRVRSRVRPGTSSSSRPPAAKRPPRPRWRRCSPRATPPVKTVGTEGSPARAAPCAAYAFSCDVMYMIGARPRPIRSRLRAMKSCSGCGQLRELCLVDLHRPTPSRDRALSMEASQSGLLWGVFAAGLAGGRIPGRAGRRGRPSARWKPQRAAMHGQDGEGRGRRACDTARAADSPALSAGRRRSSRAGVRRGRTCTIDACNPSRRFGERPIVASMCSAVVQRLAYPQRTPGLRLGRAGAWALGALAARSRCGPCTTHHQG